MKPSGLLQKTIGRGSTEVQVPLESRPITSPTQLANIYDPPGPIAVEKVVHHFDEPTTAFMTSATFFVANVSLTNGHFFPLLVGGAPGFARVLSATTAEFEFNAALWPDDKAPCPDGSAVDIGLLVIIPGTRETLRMKGSGIMMVSSADTMTCRLQLASAFFHCGKAFIRSHVWDSSLKMGAWRGLRSFVCTNRVDESDRISSFEFRPLDGGALPDFVPGQHVALELDIPGQERPLRRVYSLSARPGLETFRITVKRDFGAGSNHLHDRVHAGTIVQMRSPSGSFGLRASSSRPLALVSAGVGLTPLVSMLEHLVHTQDARQVWFVHGAVSRAEHAMASHLRSLVESLSAGKMSVFYSKPGPEDRQGVDYDRRGRITVDYLQTIPSFGDCDFYVCGPPGFMQSIASGLKELRIDPARLRMEAFSGTLISQEQAIMAGTVGECTVTFAESGKAATWTAGSGSLLDFVHAQGFAVPSSCRNGNCFSCETRLLSGRVVYQHALDDVPEDSMVLLCSARPDGDITLKL